MQKRENPKLVIPEPEPAVSVCLALAPCLAFVSCQSLLEFVPISVLVLMFDSLTIHFICYQGKG